MKLQIRRNYKDWIYAVVNSGSKGRSSRTNIREIKADFQKKVKEMKTFKEWKMMFRGRFWLLKMRRRRLQIRFKVNVLEVIGRR